MSVILVRHGLLADEGARPSDDDVGLSDRGRRQARRLVETLGAAQFSRVISSALMACTQTAEPLAAARGLRMETNQLLDSDPVDVVAVTSLLLATCDEGVVACAARELIEAVIGEARSSGCALVLPDGDTSVRYEKGSAWVLECQDARFVRATYVPPPPRSGTSGAHTHPSFTADAPRRSGSR